MQFLLKTTLTGCAAGVACFAFVYWRTLSVEKDLFGLGMKGSLQTRIRHEWLKLWLLSGTVAPYCIFWAVAVKLIDSGPLALISCAVLTFVFYFYIAASRADHYRTDLQIIGAMNFLGAACAILIV